MITPELRHRHSGLAGDGEKIKYSDIEGVPTSTGGKFFVGNTTINGTGNLSITGVGFKPSAVRFIVGDNIGNPSYVSIGAMFSNGGQYAMNFQTSACDNTRCIHLGSKCGAKFVSMDSDGFTINCDYWTNTAYVTYECS